MTYFQSSRGLHFDHIERVIAWLATVKTPESQAAMEFLEHHIFIQVEREVVVNLIDAIQDKYKIDLQMSYEEVSNLCMAIQDHFFGGSADINSIIAGIVKEQVFLSSYAYMVFITEYPQFSDGDCRSVDSKVKHAAKEYNKWIKKPESLALIDRCYRAGAEYLQGLPKETRLKWVKRMLTNEMERVSKEPGDDLTVYVAE